MAKIFIEKGKVPAGWLIENSGLKGLKIGGAEVSSKHANFLINSAQASADNIVDLIEQIKEKVYNKYKVNLEEEIRLID